MTLPHLSDDELERLVLEQLDAETTALAEEHILGCPSCAGRLDEIRRYVMAMREALRRLSDSGML